MNEEYNSQNSQENENETTSKEKKPRKIVWLSVKILIIALVVAAIFYVTYFSSRSEKAGFILSNKEIQSKDALPVKEFTTNEKIYFYIYESKKPLEATLLSIEIMLFDGTAYQSYKKVTWELDADYTAIASSFPIQYFQQPGTYQLHALLDGKEIAVHDIIVKNVEKETKIEE